MTAVDFGSLPGWITLAVLLAAFIVFLRGGGGVALSHLRDANEELTKTIARQDAKLREAEREISELRGRTDVSIAIATAIGPIVEWSSAHESRAQDRHDKTMVVLELIASRLGPDPNGGH
jgi:hypothetical protein